MDVGNEKLKLEQLIAVEGENNLRRLGAEPFWEVRNPKPCEYMTRVAAVTKPTFILVGHNPR